MSWRRSAAIARHDMRLLRADPMFFIIFTTMPLVVMAFMKPAFAPILEAQGNDGVNGAEQVVPGLTVMFALFLVGNVGFAFFREHGWNTWERVRASWARPAEIMAGKTAVPLLTGAVQLAVLLGFGGLAFGLDIRGSVLAMVLVALAFDVCLVSLGLALLAICRTVMQVNAIANLGAMVLAGVGGAMAPLDALPGWAGAVAPATPSYWAMRGFRSVILDTGGVGDVVAPVAVLLAFSVVFLAVARLRFRLDEHKVFFA